MPAFGLGLGLSTGEAAAALLGSAERLEYTLVGDTVNLSQRLQQLAVAGETVLSEATVKALSAPVDVHTAAIADGEGPRHPRDRLQADTARSRTAGLCHSRGSDMTTTDLALQLRGVRKTFEAENAPVRALRGVDLDVSRGEFVALTGPSGCGKSTLLNLAAGLDLADEGTIFVAGEEVTGQSEDDLARMRRRHIGIVFQFFNLLESVTVLENVALAAIIAGRKRRQAETRATGPARPARPRRQGGRGARRAVGRAATAAGHRQGAGERTRRCCSPTSPPGRWIPTAVRRSSSCSAGCTRAARPSCW